jgi:hypothetical protein
MSDFDGIPQTKVNVEMPPVKPPAASSPSDRILDKAELAEAISEIFAKHNKAINMTDIENRVPTWQDKWWSFKYWLKDNNPFNKYHSITSIEEFDKMPLRQKHTFLFWYNDPLLRGDGRGPASCILGCKKDREALVKYMKRKYFIQYPLRQFGFIASIRLSRYWDNFCYFLNPRQKWLTKQIPNDWTDKTHLIPLVNFAMVIDFVEGEKGLESIDWEASSDQASKFEKELRDCYDYVKNRRPKLEEDLGNSYPDEEKMTGDYHVDYADHNRLEVELNNSDTKYLTWIVVNRDFFWT